MQTPDMTPELEKRLDRIERAIDELRDDWRRDLDMVCNALREIGKALDIKHSIDNLTRQVAARRKRKKQCP